MITLKILVPHKFSSIILIPISLVFFQACASTRIGNDLANSFDSPNQQILQKEPNKVDRKPDKMDIDNSNQRNLGISRLTQSNLKSKGRNRKLSIRKVDEKIRDKDESTSFDPLPYRIIIKLSAANPSAPAEKVTKALRTAGVIFEVEMIELIENKSSPKAFRNERLAR